MKSNCLVLAQCNKWHAQISAEHKGNDSNQFIASAKCRWLFLIHQFFLIFNSVSVFQEGIVIVLSSFSSTFDKAHPSPWKTKTFIVSLVISAPFFFVFRNEMTFFFPLWWKSKCYQMDVCACVCSLWLSYMLLLKTVTSVISVSFCYLWRRYRGAVTQCEGQKLFEHTHHFYLRVLRPDLWTTVLLSLGANTVHFISEDFLPNSTKKNMDIKTLKSHLAFAGCKRMF